MSDSDEFTMFTDFPCLKKKKVFYTLEVFSTHEVLHMQKVFYHEVFCTEYSLHTKCAVLKSSNPNEAFYK